MRPIIGRKWPELREIGLLSGRKTTFSLLIPCLTGKSGQRQVPDIRGSIPVYLFDEIRPKRQRTASFRLRQLINSQVYPLNSRFYGNGNKRRVCAGLPPAPVLPLSVRTVPHWGHAKLLTCVGMRWVMAGLKITLIRARKWSAISIPSTNFYPTGLINRHGRSTPPPHSIGSLCDGTLRLTEA